LCRNCKCKKEEHDVRDDEGYEQFEILFANSFTGKKKRTGACKFGVYWYSYICILLRAIGGGGDVYMPSALFNYVMISRFSTGFVN
jgi:hypothetical protein